MTARPSALHTARQQQLPGKMPLRSPGRTGRGQGRARMTGWHHTEISLSICLSRLSCPVYSIHIHLSAPSSPCCIHFKPDIIASIPIRHPLSYLAATSYPATAGVSRVLVLLLFLLSPL